MRGVWLAPLVFVACNPLDGCETDPTLEAKECIAQRDDPFTAYAASDDGECGDTFEPNEDLTEAATESRRACEVTSTSPRRGSVRDQTDVDVFRTGACDRGRLASIGDTRVTVTSKFATDDSYLRLCIFAMCHDGATNLQACSGDGDDGTTTRVDSSTKKEDLPKHLWSTRLDSGFTGCCRVGQGALELELVCQYASREIDTFFWVDTIDPDATCVDYEFTYKVD